MQLQGSPSYSDADHYAWANEIIARFFDKARCFKVSMEGRPSVLLTRLPMKIEKKESYY